MPARREPHGGTGKKRIKRFLVAPKVAKQFPPDYYYLIRAAKFLGVPPWELWERKFSILWQQWARICETAELEAKQEREERENKKGKGGRGAKRGGRGRKRR